MGRDVNWIKMFRSKLSHAYSGTKEKGERTQSDTNEICKRIASKREEKIPPSKGKNSRKYPIAYNYLTGSQIYLQ